MRILRQLVELQLCHSTEIKNLIDRAWGVVHNKHKKNNVPPTLPDPSDPKSRENITLLPLGQDSSKKRYWVVDGACLVCLPPALPLLRRWRRLPPRSGYLRVFTLCLRALC